MYLNFVYGQKRQSITLLFTVIWIQKLNMCKASASCEATGGIGLVDTNTDHVEPGYPKLPIEQWHLLSLVVLSGVTHCTHFVVNF